MMVNNLSKNSFDFMRAVKECVMDTYEIDVGRNKHKENKLSKSEINKHKKHVGVYKNLNGQCKVTFDEKDGMIMKVGDTKVRLIADGNMKGLYFFDEEFSGHVVFTKNKLLLIQDMEVTKFDKE